MSPPRNTPSHNTYPGYALIVALVLMSFLVLLMANLSLLVNIELGTSDIAQKQQRAQENALLGLYVALGQLQQYAGPDARVTARGDIMDTDPETETPDGINNPWLTGIWNVAFDRSSSAPQLPVFLISGNETLGFDPENDSAYPSGYVTPNSPQVEGDGTVSLLSITNDSSDPDFTLNVNAPLVPIETNGSESGQYAYWVSDENVKMKLNPENGTMLSEQLNKPEADNYLTVKLPDIAQFSRLSELSRNSDARSNSFSVTTMSQLALIDGIDNQSSKAVVHDITPYSQSLLAKTTPNDDASGNVLEYGGLKRDLTTGLFMKGSSGDGKLIEALRSEQGIQNPRIFPPVASSVASADANPGGPFWEQIQSYVDMTPASGTRSSATFTPRAQTATQMGIYPILTYGQFHINMRLVQQPSGLYRVWYYIRPTFVLWNPYNAKLSDKDYYVGLQLNTVGADKLRWKYEVVLREKTDANGNGVLDTEAPLTGTTELDIIDDVILPFKLSLGRAMEPGEVVAFTPPDDGTTDINFVTSASGGLTLEPGFRDGAAYAFEDAASDFPIDAVNEEVYSVGFAPVGGNGLQGRVWLALGLSGLSLNPDPDSVLQYVQQINSYGFSSDSIETTINNKRTKVTADDNIQHVIEGIPFYLAPISLDTAMSRDAGQSGELFLFEIPANFALMFGMRFVDNTLRYADLDSVISTAGDYYRIPWLAQYNPRASYLIRSPLEDDYPGRRGGTHTTPNYYSTTYTPFEMVNDGELYQIDVDPSGIHAYVGYSDTAEGATNAILFQLPRSPDEVRSIGDLMHVNFSHASDLDDVEQNWARSNYTPAFAIGNSLGEPQLPLDKTSVDFYVGSTTKIQKPHAYYDYSYLLNQALWDDYFFSTLPVDGASQTVSVPSPFNLNNTMLVESASPQADYWEDYEHVAANLTVDGGFNVNSTSVEAWKSLLASFFGVKFPLGSTGSYQEADRSPFVRTAYPQSEIPEGVTPTDTAAYNGFRSLAQNQIDDLAEALVTQIKERGPFSSLADFINRSHYPKTLQGKDVSTDTSGDTWSWYVKGPMQAAIDATEINEGFYNSPEKGLSDDHVFNIPEGKGTEFFPDDLLALNEKQMYFKHFEREAMEVSLAANSPGFLSQADILARLGPLLQARSDTFTIRFYGSATNPITGKVESEAWGVAIVQRTIDKVDSTANIESGDPVNSNSLGRCFRIVQFRWLSDDEV